MRIMLERRRRNPLYDFLMNPRFGKWRWFAYAFLMFLITMREVMFTYQSGIKEMQAMSLVVILVTFVINIALSTTLFLHAVPKYLFRNRYVMFLFFLFSYVLASLVLKSVIEYVVVRHYHITSLISSGVCVAAVLEWISKYTTVLICIFGAMSIFLLKNWIREKKHIRRLENSQLKSELESLKEQVSPNLLLGVLHKLGEEAERDSQKSSDMLLLLSQVLRYELYDCNRNRVLLSSEVKFLSNYLVLCKFYLESFDYTLTTKGNVNVTFLPPMLLVFFVQVLAEQIYIEEQNGNKDKGHVDFELEVENKILRFTCLHAGQNVTERVSFSDVKRRLGLLFGDRWSIVDEDGLLELKIDVHAK